jgi:hypothetical protein
MEALWQYGVVQKLGYTVKSIDLFDTRGLGLKQF